jgi:hypothetical protein
MFGDLSVRRRLSVEMACNLAAVHRREIETSSQLGRGAVLECGAGGEGSAHLAPEMTEGAVGASLALPDAPARRHPPRVRSRPALGYPRGRPPPARVAPVRVAGIVVGAGARRTRRPMVDRRDSAPDRVPLDGTGHARVPVGSRHHEPAIGNLEAQVRTGRGLLR